MKKFLSSLLSLVMVFSMTTTTFAIDTPNGTGEVPVELTQAVSAFSVTVPTVLPIDLAADGTITVSTDNKIVNNSFGPVEVKGIQVNPQNGWTLQEFTTDFKTKQVGLKEFGFQMNTTNVATDGSCTVDTFQPIDGNSDLAFTYDANVATQNVALEDYEIAQVVFTMGWYSNGSSNSGAYASTFADNSWEEIIEACEADEVPDTWNVGDTKPMEIDGTEYNIQIIGKDHDTYTAGGTAPLTFQLVEIYTESRMNASSDNTTGWSGSEMRTTTLSTVLSAMPIEVQSAIKAVDKQTLNGDKSGLETTSDTLFLLSEVEVFGTTNYSNGFAEGSRYAYYANGGSTIKTYNGSADCWWLRGPHYDSYNGFSSVYSHGNLGNSGADGTSGGVAFVFCF